MDNNELSFVLMNLEMLRGMLEEVYEQTTGRLLGSSWGTPLAAPGSSSTISVDIQVSNLSLDPSKPDYHVSELSQLASVNIMLAKSIAAMRKQIVGQGES